MKIEELVKEKRKEILRIAAKYGAINIRLIGSAARGETNPESDIDFLVQFKEGCSLLDHAGLMLELENLLGHKVDIASERGLRKRVQNRIFKEAVSL